MFKGSIWEKEIEFEEREALKGKIKTEVAVIGGGMAGILIADRLQNAGKNVIILEANRIASGYTKNTTAKITAQHNNIYSKITNSYGKDYAKIYAKANMRAVEWFKETVEKRDINCDFEIKDAYLYSENKEKLKEEEKACLEIGLPVEWVDEPNLPFKTASALKLPLQAQFNPLKFINHIAKGLKIYEKTEVKKIKGKVLLGEGFSVEAKKIVFACHYPFVNFPGFYFAKMYGQRSYVLALENAMDIDGMFIGTEKGDFSFRRYKDLLLFGGAQHRTGENFSGDKYETLRIAAKELFPEAKEVAAWSAQDCITADDIPYIGKFSKTNNDIFVATGFGKWGMTTSAVSAKIITDLIVKGKSPLEKVFSPSRCSLKAVGGITDEILHSSKGLLKRFLCIPSKRIEDIKIGEGGAILYEGRRVGVFRETEDKYHFVKIKCPHLGCRLEWNQDEKSWDCPCHSSRFDYKGRLINGPAQIDISLEK